ncbi:LacI family DNA-binding transcriptional regulator [Pseudomonas vanderleydeniana]|uniref:LacI family DNA-binding transcriptional regulator n=1 Tax=Pseudomonas vanderleydeniana TaxID=2745495 RepID=A0A9E6PQU0_9PSED|nr:LacI family DNA-binding transcriptional regulator [Pseudomonas vanderleydeniana]QXI30888.1 LacI family DNA-binding transcriptional regulator [Pseudomonas vanderleydeniana]
MASDGKEQVRATVTLSDVARLAGVAPMTVSRYLNQPEAVREPTRLKVRRAIEQTGYVHNRLAGALRSNRTRLVAVVLPMVTNPIFSDTFQAINDRLAKAGYQVLLGVSGYQSEQEQELLEVILSRRPDGIILTGTMHTNTSRNRLRTAGVPVVETWDLSAEPIDMLVGFSHEQAGRDVARLLAGQGYRQFALFAVDDPRGMRRANSFIQTLAEQGIDNVHRKTWQGLPTLEQGRQGLSQLLQEQGLDSREPCVVVCTSDTIAHGVLTEAAARGIAVPGQLAVMGFGDMAFAAHTFPALSTVRIDGAALGDTAARLLLERLQGEHQASTVVDIGFSLIQRASTGPAV